MGKAELPPITEADLRALAELALGDFHDLERRTGRSYGKPMLIALCQGAALYYLGRSSRLNDFDVWVFVPRDEAHDRFPHRRVKGVPFGNAPTRAFRAKRVDLLGRSIPHRPGRSPIESVRAWLQGGNESPQELRKKACIAIWPEEVLGQVIWPIR